LLDRFDDGDYRQGARRTSCEGVGIGHWITDEFRPYLPSVPCQQKSIAESLGSVSFRDQLLQFRTKESPNGPESQAGLFRRHEQITLQSGVKVRTPLRGTPVAAQRCEHYVMEADDPASVSRSKSVTTELTKPERLYHVL
jgi:hypothetical protein